MEKTGYISPEIATLSLIITNDAYPTVTFMLDLGIPNFTVFSLKFPYVKDETLAMRDLCAEALEVLLDEVAAFMISMKYEEDVCVALYAACLNCFTGMGVDSETESHLKGTNVDPTIREYQGTFRIPQSFVDETYDRVITAASLVKRPPPYRQIVLQKTPPAKQTLTEAAKAIRMYRNRTLRTQPSKLFVIVYDQNGKAVGTTPWSDKVRKKLMASESE